MAATANKETKKLANTWFCQAISTAYINSAGVPSVFDFDDFQNAWRKKRSHIFFDKSLKVQFVLPDNALNSWPQVEKSFEQLRSSSVMHMVVGSIGQSTTATKQSGGATSTISTSHLSLSRTLPKGIKSDTKPLTFETDGICVHVFPAFVAIERDDRVSVFPLYKVKLTRESKLMVGKAPRDAEVVGQTWKYVNVSGRNKGEPDKRRTDNELLDNYKVDAINLCLDKNAEVLEFRFSNAVSSQLFSAMFAVYMFAMFADKMNELEAESVTRDLSVSASSSEPVYVIVTSGIVSSGEDRTQNPTETDIKNTVESLNALEDDDFAWMRLECGDNTFIQSAKMKGEIFSLEYNDGKEWIVATRNFHNEEIFLIFSAFAKGDLSWKGKIEWEPQGPTN